MEIKFLMRLFDYKTGCLITVDGSGDFPSRFGELSDLET